MRSNIALLLTFFLIGLMSTEAFSAQEIGVVIGLQGKAWAQKDTQKRGLQLKGPLHEQETVHTGENSRLQILFLDDSILAVGPKSSVKLSKYIYDPENDDAQGCLLNLSKGAFRTITGKIAEHNPDNFKMESPLTLIGIRGTMTGHVVSEDSEKHYALELSKGHTVVVQDKLGLGQSVLDQDGLVSLVLPDQPPGEAQKASPEELNAIQSGTQLTQTKTEQNGQQEDGFPLELGKKQEEPVLPSLEPTGPDAGLEAPEVDDIQDQAINEVGIDEEIQELEEQECPNEREVPEEQIIPDEQEIPEEQIIER